MGGGMTKLVLSVKEGESVLINGHPIQVVRARGKRAKLVFLLPKSMRIVREAAQAKAVKEAKSND